MIQLITLGEALSQLVGAMPPMRVEGYEKCYAEEKKRRTMEVVNVLCKVENRERMEYLCARFEAENPNPLKEPILSKMTDSQRDEYNLLTSVYALVAPLVHMRGADLMGIVPETSPHFGVDNLRLVDFLTTTEYHDFALSVCRCLSMVEQADYSSEACPVLTDYVVRERQYIINKVEQGEESAADAVVDMIAMLRCARNHVALGARLGMTKRMVGIHDALCVSFPCEFDVAKVDVAMEFDEWMWQERDIKPKVDDKVLKRAVYEKLNELCGVHGIATPMDEMCYGYILNEIVGFSYWAEDDGEDEDWMLFDDDE